jgi:hypothetical protein
VNPQLEPGERLIDDRADEEKAITQFPPETVDDLPGTVSEEKWHNIHQKLIGLNTQQKIRLAQVANLPTRMLFIQSPIKVISLAVLKNPKLTESEVLRYSQQKNLVDDVLVAIAKDPKWIKTYPIKLAIVSNPKTPLSISVNFLSHLHENDLKALSRDKNISSVLSRAAHQMLMKRNKLSR